MKEIFSFNLLPHQKGEKKEEKKFSSLIYSLILLLVGVFVWIFITIANYVFVYPSYKNKLQDNLDLKNKMKSYSVYVASNGELVTKTNILDEVILEHTDPSLVFGVIDNQIKMTVPSALILRYGRSSTGNYQVTAKVDDVYSIFKLIKAFSINEKVNDASLITLNKADDGYIFILDLNLNLDNKN